jgi:hypothetical protein
MDDQEILNRIREAIAAMDGVHLALNTMEQRKVYRRVQDAADRLVEVREELQTRMEIQANAKKAIERMSQ